MVGPAALHLDLSLAAWANDGLLTIFFFVVGLELKREIVAGELRRPASAALPVVAAVGGMLVPAALFVLVNLSGGDLRGWAVPTATDIAFAIAVLAVVGRSLPNSLRAFLLTLAVVDDLLAIIVIAVAYSDSISLGWLAASLGAVAVFGLLTRRRITSAWLLVPIGVVAWAFMHASGVHATIAGVLLGLVVPGTPDESEEHCLAAHIEHRWRPISAGFAVPVFALLAAGVALNPEALLAAAKDPVAQGVGAGARARQAAGDPRRHLARGEGDPDAAGRGPGLGRRAGRRLRRRHRVHGVAAHQLPGVRRGQRHRGARPSRDPGGVGGRRRPGRRRPGPPRPAPRRGRAAA